MTLKSIEVRASLSSWTDLTTPTSTQQYPLGLEVWYEDDSKKTIQKYMYVKSHTGLTAYQPYVLSIGAVAGSEIVTAAPATMGAPGSIVVIPQVTFTSGYYGFVLAEGDGKALMISETYAIGDMLQILNTGTALVVDGSTGSTAYSVNTCAICKEAGTTAVARNCWLKNRQAIVAAT